MVERKAPSSAPRIVGLSGYAGSGKDSAARALTNIGWERRACADRIRELMLAVNPIVPWEGMIRLSDLVAQVGWDRAKNEVSEVRALLQRCGPAGHAVLGEDVWSRATLGDIGPHAPGVVVTDVRYPCEARAIRSMGGVVVRVHRPGVGPLRGPDGIVHASETAMCGWDFDGEVFNDGDLEDLERSTLALISDTWSAV